MLAQGLVLREVTLLCGHKRRVGWLVPLLFPCCAGTRRGQAPRWSEMHSCSYAMSEAQVQAFETEPTPGSLVQHAG
jgi:hypothetical protein